MSDTTPDSFEQLVQEQLDYADPNRPPGFWRRERARAAILVAHRAEVVRERKAEARRIYDAIKDMEAAYPEAGRTLSKGEIIKWLEFELGIGTGRNG